MLVGPGVEVKAISEQGKRLNNSEGDPARMAVGVRPAPKGSGNCG